MTFKPGFSRFLQSDPRRLHAAAHSHHPWPDVTFAAHQQAWLDAAELHDTKWEKVFGDVLPETQRHIAARLRLPDPSTIAFAPNTHELVMRLLSCLPARVRILTTDAEFHSFARQVRRLEEEGLAHVQRVAVEPFESLADRLVAAAAGGGHDLVFFSQVLFDSGYAFEDLTAVVAAVPDDDTYVVIDGYHGFMALPTDLSRIADRAFYLAGGYKYAMAGEGTAFLHCPPGYGERPRNTGWFAGFAELEAAGPGERVGFPADGSRFLGATFDPSGLYRFNAVQRWLGDIGLDVAAIHTHVGALQRRFLDQVDSPSDPLVTGAGHFLCFPLADAAAVSRSLAERNVVTDYRGDRLRIGFGIYHDPEDVDELATRLARTLSSNG